MRIKIIKFKFLWRKWKIVIIIGILILLGILSTMSYILIEKRKVVAIVNGYKITVDDIVNKIKSSPEFYREYALFDLNSVIEDYINQVLLFQYAKRYERKLKKKIENEMRNYYMEILSHAFVENILSNQIKITDDEISSYYNTHLNEFIVPERVQISEIVVDSKEKADEILSRLRLGESFEEIAQKESIAPTREKRGEIGWIDVEKLNPEVASLLSKVRPGEILANIIKSEMGYHIIKLTGRTEKKILTLSEATPVIKNLLLSQKKKLEVENLMKKLKEKSRIKKYPDKIEIIKEKIK
jgi:peptidyl-prolyl cis-trans isomerase C